VVIRSRPATARTAKTRPAYAIDSVDHALRLAAMLQLEGALTVSDAAERLGVARSTAHRVLAMLVYRDFAVQGPDRRYHAGPVLELATHSRSLTARLRSVALAHLEGLVAVLGESANLIIRTGDRVRFIASAESTQALRVEQREGMVFPAHLVSGGLVLLAEAGEDEVTALYAGGDAGEAGTAPGAPDLRWLRAELRRVKARGYAVNRETSEKGVTAVGRAVRDESGVAVAAVSISMPSARYAATDLPRITGALTLAARAIEADLAADRP
jgi:DNA-binding IclR family transcriptional regulator